MRLKDITYFIYFNISPLPHENKVLQGCVYMFIFKCLYMIPIKLSLFLKVFNKEKESYIRSWNSIFELCPKSGPIKANQL